MLEAQLASKAVTRIGYENWSAELSDEYASSKTSGEWRGLSTSHRPLYAFVGFQIAHQYSQQQDLGSVNLAQSNSSNPLQYVSATGGTVGITDITQVNLKVGSRVFPNERFESDFSEDLYSRAFNEFLRVTQKSPFDPEDSSIVNFKDFRWQYPLYAFDLRELHDMFDENGDGRADININWQVEAGSTSNYRLIMILATEREFTLAAVGGALAINQ